jgi:cytochrome o ubiquinol oxidase subunit 2
MNRRALKVLGWRVVMASGVLLLTACTGAAVLMPGGIVAEQQRDLLATAAALMLIVVIPVFGMCGWFAWHYRSSNARARYAPAWDYSLPIDVMIWLVPGLLISVLAVLVWVYSYRLDPYKVVPSTRGPIEVQVIAQDWKWLFLYPEQHIAVVNELVFPSDRALSLKLTSDTVMNAFHIPGLGGQIYVMAGMQTELHLKANGTGNFIGRNVQFSGEGFSGQTFLVHATSDAEFAAWLARVKGSNHPLDEATYAELRRPSSKVPATYYSDYNRELYDRVIARYVNRPSDAPHPSVTTAFPPGARY